MPPNALLEALTSARQVATHAEQKGISVHALTARPAVDHVGAILADCVLQAGLNYRTVVWPRVKRIQDSFPLAAQLSGVKAIVDCGQVDNFLSWKHPGKLSRFVDLVNLLDVRGIEDVADLRGWLDCASSREQLLNLKGIGPKTYDYMCCMVGIDRVAVDRHVRSFASEAGVGVGDYNDLQVVVSYAADLLGLTRRDFDAWIWRLQARNPDPQLELF